MDLRTPFGQRLKSALTSSPPSSGRTVTPVTPRFPAGKRDMVHRLRDQLKSRDEIIMQMQTQILEQNRLVNIHQVQMGDLEELLRTTNRSLFQAEQEIDQLKKTLAESCTCRPASCQVRKRACLCTDDQGDMTRSQTQGQQEISSQKQDITTLVSEAQRLTRELKHIGELKRDRKTGDHIACLESELAEARETASRNAALFEECEMERVKLSCALSELQQKLQSQAIKLETIRAHTTGTATTIPEISTQRQDYVRGGFESPVTSGSIMTNGEDTDEEVSRLSVEMDNVTMVDEKNSVRLGSPTITGLSSGEGSKGSFGGFVFDMEQDNQVVMLNNNRNRVQRGDETCYRDYRMPKQGALATGMSPFSKMMTKLDLLRSSTAGLPLTDSLIVAETVERNISSLDYAFHKVILDNKGKADNSNNSRSSSTMSIVVD